MSPSSPSLRNRGGAAQRQRCPAGGPGPRWRPRSGRKSCGAREGLFPPLDSSGDGLWWRGNGGRRRWPEVDAEVALWARGRDSRWSRRFYPCPHVGETTRSRFFGVVPRRSEHIPRLFSRFNIMSSRYSIDSSHYIRGFHHERG